MSAPSVTPAQIADILKRSEVSVQTIFEKVTFVSARLPNGFVLTASSGAVSKENYDEKTGAEICMKQIEDQLWKLEGYTLQKNLSEPDHDLNSLSVHTFGSALQALKNGHKVAREGWNGKGMWIALSGTELRASRVSAENLWSPHSRAEAEAQGGSIEVLPAIIMRTADGKIAMGWLASQMDMLAEDWIVL